MCMSQLGNKNVFTTSIKPHRTTHIKARMISAHMWHQYKPILLWAAHIAFTCVATWWTASETLNCTACHPCLTVIQTPSLGIGCITLLMHFVQRLRMALLPFVVLHGMGLQAVTLPTEPPVACVVHGSSGGVCTCGLTGVGHPPPITTETAYGPVQTDAHCQLTEGARAKGMAHSRGAPPLFRRGKGRLVGAVDLLAPTHPPPPTGSSSVGVPPTPETHTKNGA